MHLLYEIISENGGNQIYFGRVQKKDKIKKQVTQMEKKKKSYYIDAQHTLNNVFVIGT